MALFSGFLDVSLGDVVFFETSFVTDAFSETKTQMIPMYPNIGLVWL